MANYFVMKYSTSPIFRIFVLPNCQGLGPSFIRCGPRQGSSVGSSFIHPGGSVVLVWLPRYCYYGLPSYYFIHNPPGLLKKSQDSFHFNSASRIPPTRWPSNLPLYCVSKAGVVSRCVVHQPPTYRRPSYLPAFPRETSLASLAWHCS